MERTQERRCVSVALLGIGHIFVIDLDEIEDSNLTRSVLFRHEDCGKSKAIAAAEELRCINPDVRVTPIHGNVITDGMPGIFDFFKANTR